MASQTLVIAYSKNSDLVLSATELKQLYFFGIPVRNPAGDLMSDEAIDFYIRAAQEQLENELSVKFNKQVYEENRDFVLDDFRMWSYIPTTYPVRKALSLQGLLGSTVQVDYPPEWLSIKKQRNEEDLYHRKINLVPVSGAVSTLSSNAGYSSVSPYLGYFGNKQIPDYWSLRYITGFKKVPNDILHVMGMMASIPIFNILGDIVLGSGLQSISIGIDGLSQSVGTTNSSTNAGFGARIIQYKKDIQTLMPTITARYKGIIFTVA